MAATDTPHRETPDRGEMLASRFEIRATLSGAMGTVLLLVDPASGTRLAAKTPDTGPGVSEGALRRFAAEAGTWLSLGHHENVVEALFVEDLPWRGRTRPFLFLEYVDGPTLESVVQCEGRLSVPVVLDVATGMAWGMAHAHGEDRAGPRIVHRDLKPGNVFLTRDRVVKVSDFGIARALDRPEEAAPEGAGLGTPFYAAPEQMKDARRADARSDVYSYGAVVYELLTGRPPFPATDLSSLVWKVLREEPPPPGSLVPDVPPSLERLVLGCLAKEPAARPQSFRRILEEVSEIRESDDRLWVPSGAARSCETCGWLSGSGRSVCSVCGMRTGPPVRYAPASRRYDVLRPTLGRSSVDARIVVEGVQVRPRVPQAGEDVVVTVLLGNPGGAPVGNAVLPFMLPDADAFTFVDGRAWRGFRGTVPPTADTAPLRISWTIRPLREGRYVLRAPRVSWRADDGVRRSARGEAVELEVVPNEAAALVGRERELAELTECLDLAAGRTGALVLLTGQPGTGKSRLTREIAADAAEAGFAAGRGRCLDRGVEVRGALKEALRQLLSLPRAGSRPPEVAAALVGFLGVEARPEPGLLSFLVDELLGRPVAPGESPAHMWARFAAAAGRRRPLLLVFEDVQRDPEVGAIALRMASEARRERVGFLAVLTSRPGHRDGSGDLAARVEADAAASGLARVVRLEPLGREAAARLVTGNLAPNDFPTTAPWLAEELAVLSGGNPLFLTELLRTLRAHAGAEGAAVVTHQGLWTVAPGLTPERLRQIVPRRLEEAMLASLVEHREESQRFARAAAVLGDAFESDLLRKVLDEPPWFESALRDLEGAGVLREIGSESPRIRFREPLLPEILDRELLAADPAEHLRLHRRAAELLAHRPGARSRNALRLGRHLVAAGRARLAFAALVDAARRLVDRQSFRRAELILEDAGRLLREGTRPPRAALARYHALRGDARRFTGDFSGALEDYRAAVDLARGGEGELAALYGKMGKAHEQLGELDEALYCFGFGLALRREHGRSDEAPISMVNLAGLHFLRGDVDRAEAELDEAGRAAAEVDNSRALARVFVLRARLCVARGETRECRWLLRNGLREARRARDRSGGAEAWSVLGHANLREGRPLRALVHFRRALRIRQETGELAATGATWSEVGTAHEAMGELERAAAAHQRAVEIHRRTGSRRGVAGALASLGRVLLASGEPRRARQSLEEARAEHASVTGGGDAVFALCDLVHACLAAGDGEAAARVLEEARTAADQARDVEARGRVGLAAAEEALARGDCEAAVRAARDAAAVHGVSPDVRVRLLSLVAECADDPAVASEAAALATHSADPRVRARALAARARVDLRAGDTASAAALLRRAAGALFATGARDALLLGVLEDQARALATGDPAASAAAAARAANLAQELTARGGAVSAPPRSSRDPAGGAG